VIVIVVGTPPAVIPSTFDFSGAVESILRYVAPQLGWR
jgi:hypothetical protein